MKKLALVWLTTVALVAGVTISTAAWSAGPGGFHGYGGYHGGGFHGYGGYHGGGFHGYGGYQGGGFHGYGGYPTRYGVFIGTPFFWWPYYYPYPAAVYPPAAYIAQGSPVYIAQKPYYWYYCPDPGAYYPYVQSCPRGWVQVVPESPPK